MKKKQLVGLLVLFSLVMILGAVFFYVLNIYRGTGLSMICEWNEAYTYNGKLLLAEDGSKALLVKTLGKTDFETLPKMVVDLSSFGFEGKEISLPLL
jgi:hypothetical protein